MRKAFTAEYAEHAEKTINSDINQKRNSAFSANFAVNKV